MTGHSVNSSSILLDTHVWVWSQGLPEKLRADVSSVINEAASRNALFVSVISIWELALLEYRERILLEGGVQRWSRKALQVPGLNLLPFSPEIAIESVNLPLPMHKDPADRILVATARIEGLTLVTADTAILDFAKATQLACLRA